MPTPLPLRLPEILRDTIVSLVRRSGPDLTARQFSVLLICYLEEGPHTVRGLASRLMVAKPAITRALDRLEEFELARRVPDPRDRRSIMVGRTNQGERYIDQLRALMEEAARNTAGGAGTPSRTKARRG